MGPVSNSRITGLDDVVDGVIKTPPHPEPDFVEPLTKTQRLMAPTQSPRPPTPSQFLVPPVEKPPDPDLEVKSEKDAEISDLIEIPDDNDEDGSNLIEVVRKEIIEIRTTKFLYVEEKKISERTKVKFHEHSTTIRMTQEELDRKISKPVEKRIKLENTSEKVLPADRTITRRSPDQLPNLIKRPQISRAASEIDENSLQSVKSIDNESTTDFTKLFIKEELTMTDDKARELCRSSDVLEIGVRCWVKYDQFYYPAIVHELLGSVFQTFSKINLLNFCFNH